MRTPAVFALILSLGLFACSENGSPPTGSDCACAADLSPYDSRPASDSLADAGPPTPDLPPADLPQTDGLRDLPAVDGPPAHDSVPLPADLPSPADLGVACPANFSGTTDDYAAYQRILACLGSSATASDKQAAIAAFVTTVEARGGFPIVSGAKVAFVYLRSATWDSEDDKSTEEDFALARRQPPLTVAGSFNNWLETQHTLVDAGQDFFHLEVTIANVGTSTDRLPYKFIGRDAQAKTYWFSDPLARRFGFDGYGRYSLLRGGNDAGQAIGHLEWIRNVRSQLLGGVDRRIYVYLPRGYDQSASSTKRYPVLYLQDGNNGFDPLMPNANGTWDADGVADLEIAAGNIKEVIIVGIPNNADRMNEYTHVPDQLSGSTIGGKGDKYVDYIVSELKPVIDARYRTLTDKANTAVLGSSLGGLISIYAGLRHPTVFKYVGGMSSTLSWGKRALNNATMAELYDQVPNLPGRDQVYYLDSGGNPPCPPPGSDDNYCDTLAFRDKLIAKGVNVQPTDPNVFPLQPANINLYYHHEAGAQHNEAAWNKRLYRPLRLFFRP